MDKNRITRCRPSSFGFGSAVVLAMLSSATVACEASLDEMDSLVGESCIAGECAEQTQLEAAIDLEDLVCSNDTRVILDAVTAGGGVTVSSCFYIHNSELTEELAPIADAYASVLDADGVEIANLPLPEESKVWLTNGLGGNIWFWSGVYAPDAASVDLYLRGRVSEDWERIGTTDVPGYYESDTFDVPGDDPPSTPPVEPPNFHERSASDFTGDSYLTTYPKY